MTMIRRPVRPSSVHIPVLLTEILAALRPAPGNTVIDATVNGGGHAHALLREIGPTGRLLGLDRDPTVIERLRAVVASEIEDGRLRLVAANFAHLSQVARSEGFIGADAIVFDLGLSTHHLEADFPSSVMSRWIFASTRRTQSFVLPRTCSGRCALTPSRGSSPGMARSVTQTA